MGDEIIPDEEGQDLPDQSAARQEALLAAREMLANAVKAGKTEVPEAFIITDEHRRAVATIPLFTALPKSLRA
jgi:hypothetical protein